MQYFAVSLTGSDCIDAFREMSACMAQYPGVYASDDKKAAMGSLQDEDEEDTSDISPTKSMPDNQTSSVSIQKETDQSKS